MPGPCSHLEIPGWCRVKAVTQKKLDSSSCQRESPKLWGGVTRSSGVGCSESYIKHPLLLWKGWGCLVSVGWEMGIFPPKALKSLGAVPSARSQIPLLRLCVGPCGFLEYLWQVTRWLGFSCPRRGCHPHPLGQHSQKGRSPWTSSVNNAAPFDIKALF